MKPVYLLLSAAILTIISCKSHKQHKPDISKEPISQIHQDNAGSWIQIESPNEPKRVVIIIE